MLKFIESMNDKVQLLIYILTLTFLTTLVILMETTIKTKTYSNKITYAQASKMIAYASVEDDEYFIEDEKEWYKPYTEYVLINNYMEFENPNGYVTYKDVYKLCSKLGVGEDYFDKFGSGLLNKFENNKKIVSAETFVSIFKSILSFFEYGENVKSVEMCIAGTPSNSDAKAWQMCTSKGTYSFTGLIVQPYVDKTVNALVRDDKLLYIENVVGDYADYNNVWIMSCNKNVMQVNFYGVEREFAINNIEGDISNNLADLHISNGRVISIDIKSDVIKGKVLSASEDHIEVEGYGKIELDKDFIMYDGINETRIKNANDIIVGYDISKFIVAKGKVCGAIIGEELKEDNIRVILKTTGFKDIFYDTVEFMASSDMKITWNDGEENVAPGQIITINKDDSRFNNGRITLHSELSEITFCSINRSQGNPSYEGDIELSVYDKGIVVINEINIENYLKRVVPSEMPVSFGVNALKCQAVCARSYAYTQLTNNFYSEYGAHVDDSVSYQVYNNTLEKEDANKAISDTKGEVLYCNGEVVKAYYYSTSCGYTTDVSVWGSNPDSYPMYSSVRVNSNTESLNLSNNESFEKFITCMDENDYDYGFDLYRWNMFQDITSFSENINSKLKNTSLINPSNKYVYNDNNEMVSKNVTSVGNVNNVEVIERTTGGAIVTVKIVGSEETVIVKGESSVRNLFGNSNVTLNTLNGTRQTDKLPSAFCVVKGVYENGILKGFNIVGGGYGHGIGMSQNAVKKMSEIFNYDEILKYFYKGVEVVKKTN